MSGMYKVDRRVWQEINLLRTKEILLRKFYIKGFNFTMLVIRNL